eukprot:TRINITY_DN1668_c0_g1_i1.p3 TRINITY_DN1668_c0_g1~~TRINITY_DN1668_c0_g1_i1.p3  ORF type:complete len:121 (-),score=41.54 TRINITY_DN1668_c0_g1_i1:55-417(-)
MDLGYYLEGDNLDAALRLLDKDGNGKISFVEFDAWIRTNDKFKKLEKAQMSNMGAAVAMFKKYDKDLSGSLTIEEYKLLCEDLGQKYTPAQLETALKALDKDSDGKVGFNEFLDWLGWFK